MFDTDVDMPSAADLLAELGINARAIFHIFDEPASFDPRGDDWELETGKEG